MMRNTGHLCIVTVCVCMCRSQDILDLGDDVFGIRALSLQRDTVSDSFLVQSGQLYFSHSQAHTALLPICANTESRAVQCFCRLSETPTPKKKKCT